MDYPQFAVKMDSSSKVELQKYWTDYWKSNPRHFCKFCKCWIADNKPCRDFHERGKNHQKNVELKLAEVRKKAVKDEQTKEEQNSYFRQMEEAAKTAFLKDLKGDKNLAQQYLKKTEEKKKAAAKAKSKEKESKGEGSSSTPQADGEGSTPQCGVAGTWRLTQSPEGYPYYWNDVTAEVSWTLPEGVTVEETEPEDTSAQTTEVGKNKPEGMSAQPGEAENEPESGETSSKTDTERVVKDTNTDVNKDTVSADTTEDLSDESGTSVTSQEDEPTDGKREVSQNSAASAQNMQASDFDLGDLSCIPLPGNTPAIPVNDNKSTEQVAEPTPQDPASMDPPASESRLGESVEEQAESEEIHDEAGLSKSVKRGHDSAYSQWETVQEDLEPVDLELPETKPKAEERVIVVSEPKLKFREKKVNTLGANLVAFKKRKMNSRSLKQRNDT